MSSTDVFHLGISKSDIKDANIVLMPGDPDRVDTIAQHLENPVLLASKREYRTILAEKYGKRVLVCSTGIGGASTAIAVEELALLGVENYIRIGTTGALQKAINPTDVIITTGAVRMEGASEHLAPIEFPAVAHFDLVRKLAKSAEKNNIPYFTGITASSATFYQGQNRKDSFQKGFVIRSLKNKLEELTQLNVLNFEMEAATVLTQTAAYGLKGSCVTGVLLNRNTEEFPTEDNYKKAVSNAIKTAVESIQFF